MFPPHSVSPILLVKRRTKRDGNWKFIFVDKQFAGSERASPASDVLKFNQVSRQQRTVENVLTFLRRLAKENVCLNYSYKRPARADSIKKVAGWKWRHSIEWMQINSLNVSGWRFQVKTATRRLRFTWIENNFYKIDDGTYKRVTELRNDPIGILFSLHIFPNKKPI